MLESLFKKVPGLKAYNFIKKRLQHRCFPVKFAKFLRTAILKNICKQLLLVMEILDSMETLKILQKSNLCSPMSERFFNRARHGIAVNIEYIYISFVWLPLVHGVPRGVAVVF